MIVDGVSCRNLGENKLQKDQKVQDENGGRRQKAETTDLSLM